MNEIFFADLFVDVGEHLAEGGTEFLLDFDWVGEFLYLVGACPDGGRCDFVFEFVLDLFGEKGLLWHLRLIVRYCFDVDVDEILL